MMVTNSNSSFQSMLLVEYEMLQYKITERKLDMNSNVFYDWDQISMKNRIFSYTHHLMHKGEFDVQ